MCENVTAIIPAYNEEKSIAATIKAVERIEFITEIIVVDDGSRDNTLKLTEAFKDVITIHHEKNKGKGFAVQSALPYVSNKFVFLIDADLGESAFQLWKLVSNTKRNTKTMLVASYPKPLIKGGFGLVKALSTKGLYLLTSKTVESPLSGQRLMSTDFLNTVMLPGGFGIEIKITLEALRNNIEIVEVPVNIRHEETGRNIKGFLHRGRQFISILDVFIRELI